mmetsp:Transcript_5087/g.10998  ORF Transcript_5087/g.10998 Transcript_5087/m.10998 type:complete len:347 (-) Transcript_5087:85-1125(-)
MTVVGLRIWTALAMVSQCKHGSGMARGGSTRRASPITMSSATRSDAGENADGPQPPPAPPPSWDGFAVEYERRVEPFTSLFAEEMFRPLTPDGASTDRDGDRGRRRRRLLDVGCGTGAASLLALSMGFDVAAADVSPAMVERTKRRATEEGGRDLFDSVAASGERLPPGWSDAFDVAVANFSVIFFPDPAAGLREMLRCLVPGTGTAALSAWGDVSETPAFRVFPDVALEVVPELVETGKPRRITGSAETLTKLMEKAGFEDVRVVGPVTRALEVANPGEYYDRFALTSPPNAAMIGKMDDATRGKFRSRIMAAATERGGREDGSVALNSSAYIVYGRRPNNCTTE